MSVNYSRRGFVGLAAAGVAAVSGLVGCSQNTKGNSTTSGGKRTIVDLAGETIEIEGKVEKYAALC